MSFLLIHLQNIFKSFGFKIIFENVSLSISRGECFALVGENGSGKTTLLRLIAALDDPDQGKRESVPGMSIGYLCQEGPVESTQTVREYLFGEIHRLEQKMQGLQDRMDDPAILAEWADLHEEFEQRGGYRISIDEMLHGLSLPMDIDRRLHSLSAGERRRVDLAKAILDCPDLLLLDEPTNHLDEKSIAWLKNQISKRTGATVIVSHDRRFLNDTCNRLIELKNHQLTRYGGNYQFYLVERQRLLEEQIQAFEKQQEERAYLKQQIQAMTFSKRKPSPPKDRNIMAYDRRGEHHQRSLAHRIDQLKERLEDIEKHQIAHPKPKSITGISFSNATFSAPVAIEWDHLSKSFDGKLVFKEQTNMLKSNERLIITGPNGSGKTTLFKCLLQELNLDTGTIRINPSVRIGYLDQEGDRLPLEKTSLKYFSQTFNLNETMLRSELHKTGLEGSDLLHLPFKSMSAGQRKRMMILSLVLSKPNVLLLDEPTNHLDLLTLEALEAALMRFSGTILAISHDATFIEKIATRQIVMEKI